MLAQFAKDVAELWNLPRTRIELMLHATQNNHPFFGDVVRKFYRDAQRRHRKFPLVRAMEFGVALCTLPQSFDDYLRDIEAAGRRNYKKAVREGCSFRRIQFNDHLDEIKEIRQSSEFRQGRRMPDSYLNDNMQPCTDPPSRNHWHDYAYFGVFLEGKLVAYAGCLISGEMASIGHILGNAQFLELGVVPFLIVELARYLQQHHPAVRYYLYGTYFGAGESLRRFKRKFLFMPHRVTWVLGETAPHLSVPSEAGARPADRQPTPSDDAPVTRLSLEVPAPLGYQLIYRQERRQPFATTALRDAQFEFIPDVPSAMKRFGFLRRHLGWGGMLKALARLATPRRTFYLVTKNGVVAATGWCTIGLCKSYRIEPEAVVVGPIWTSPTFRGQGLATYGVQRALNAWIERGRRLFYIDAHKTNHSSLRVIEKCGFGVPVALALR